MSVVNGATTVNGTTTLSLQTTGVTAATIDGNQNTSFVNTINTPNTFGFKNRIIDGGFIINQRGYVSGTALGAGAYAHDRWKAGSGGGTYTFTQAAQGVNTTITITAGTMVQIIEGCNVPEGGTYVLSWTGTAQGRLNGGSYGASGITIAGWTPGTDLPVEFNTGTLDNVQLEKGSAATSFDYRPYGTELVLCQRYYVTGLGGVGPVQSTGLGASLNISFPVAMRAVPTLSSTAPLTVYDGGSSFTQSAVGVSSLFISNMGGFAFFTNFSGMVFPRSAQVLANSPNGVITASAEL